MSSPKSPDPAEVDRQGRKVVESLEMRRLRSENRELRSELQELREQTSGRTDSGLGLEGSGLGCQTCPT